MGRGTRVTGRPRRRSQPNGARLYALWHPALAGRLLRRLLIERTGELIAALDDLLGPIHVDVAKVDTQGVDHEVLEGMTGLLRANPNTVVLSEFWLAGLQDRGIDPLGVLARYDELGFALGLLTRDEGVRSSSPRDVIDACQAWEGLFVNIVLSANRRRPALASAGRG